MTQDTKQVYRVLGTRPIRHDGADKVTGKAVYTADVKPQSMASGFILRSPHAHARIKSIDTSAAAAMEGVLSVMTAADLPDVTDKVADLGEGTVNLSNLSHNILARDKALYRGHAVAAVAAVNVHIAEEAANCIKVEYEPLESVTWVMDAMKDDAPLLHDDVFTKSGGEQSEQPSNVSVHLNFQQGDVQKGFEEADVVVEREFKMATVHQGYIEPHAVLVDWNQDGRIKVWASTQGSFTCRQQTAEVLQVPLSHVTVVPCEIGGGFGGKIAIYLEPVAAVLSRKAGRPVQIVMRRNDCFEATGPTPGAFIRVKLGATKDGKLTAGEAWLAYESGAYPGGMLGPGCMCVFSCYDIPNALVDGYEVCLNKPHIKAYRAPGATQAAFACESVIDELADKLGISILELQQKNAAKEGTRRVDGPVYPRVGFVECLEAAASSDHWNTPLEGENRGRGMASGFWFGCGLKSSVVASVNSDGTVNLTEGSTDIGGTRTSIAMQMAEVLGLESDDINPRVVDTDNIGYTDVTGGSRTTFATGMAAYEAGRDLQRQMTDRAAELWECKPEDIQITAGTFSANGNQANFKELATELFKAGEPLVGKATVAPECSTNGFGTHIVDVEVDTDTGKVTILRYTVIQDAGKAVHPSYVEGQLQGGAVQGIGWALNEEYFFDDKGEMRNASFLDYRMPTAYDLPMIDTIIVEAANPDHPYGVRGVGETPIVPPPAAIANAIHNAIGVRMEELPMSPPRLWKAIQQNQDSS
jgi:xanthine dehydrogenase molybdenum-binding subunit